MAIAPVPQNLAAQYGNTQILLTWDQSVGATSYAVLRSTDGITYTALGTSPASVSPQYLDTTCSNGTQYWYQVQAVNADGTSGVSVSASQVPVLDGTMSLGQLRLEAQQRADRVGSDFVTTSEWNNYINKSLEELYDLLVSCFGNEYYVAQPYQLSTNGASQQYPLPDGSAAYQLPNAGGPAPAFYKLLGVDCGVQTAPQNNAWLTLKRFNFIARNRYVYPQLGSTFLGIVSLQYRVLGNNIMFIPAPAGNQTIQVWYIPRLAKLLRDTDIADGVNGWLEYVIVDAALKALQKEESDVSVLGAQKAALIERINKMAENRDAGEPETISDSRNQSWGGTMNGDGSFGGY